MEFLGILTNIGSKNQLQTTFYNKPTDPQNYLHSKSEHLYSFKRNNVYSRALLKKQKCSTEIEVNKHSSNLFQQLIKKVYHRAEIEEL